MKRLLSILAISIASVLFVSASANAKWFPAKTSGTVVTYNPGGHKGDPIKILAETRTGGISKTWTTSEFWRPSGICQERVFVLSQVTSVFGVPISTVVIREAILETKC